MPAVSITFVNWERRPAVLLTLPNDHGAWATLSEGEDWTLGDMAEVVDSENPMEKETFLKMFPYVASSTIPTMSAPDETIASA